MNDRLSEFCERCEKPRAICGCATIVPVNTRTSVLILQHPQEPDKLLGSARLATLALEKATLCVGLSWPNLTKALGQPATPSAWGVLYFASNLRVSQWLARASEMGSPTERRANPPFLAGSRDTPRGPSSSPLSMLRKGRPIPLAPLEGIVVLDGTWSQAKALWWRNAWMLKLKRLVLAPPQPSLYGALRREPRRECLSTIEAIAECLAALGEDAAISTQLRAIFAAHLDRVRSSGLPIR